MNLAIRLYSDADSNPKNIPGTWPFQVIELGNSSTAPDDGNEYTVMTQEQYNVYVAAHQSEYNTWAAAQIESVEYIPDVTARQIRLALINSGVTLASIEAALDSLSEPTKSMAKIEWEYSNMFQRGRPLITTMGTMLGFSAQQLNDLWKYAASL